MERPDKAVHYKTEAFDDIRRILDTLVGNQQSNLSILFKIFLIVQEAVKGIQEQEEEND